MVSEHGILFTVALVCTNLYAVLYTSQRRIITNKTQLKKFYTVLEQTSLMEVEIDILMLVEDILKYLNDEDK